MGRLVGGIELEDRTRGRDGRHRGAVARLLLEETQEALESAFAGAEALAAKPVLERFFPDIQTGEQIPAPKLGEDRERKRESSFRMAFNPATSVVTAAGSNPTLSPSATSASIPAPVSVLRREDSAWLRLCRAWASSRLPHNSSASSPRWRSRPAGSARNATRASILRVANSRPDGSSIWNGPSSLSDNMRDMA